LPHIDTATTVRKRAEKQPLKDDVDPENSEDELSEEDEEDETDSDVESEGVTDLDERFEDQLDFMHL